MKTLIKSGDKDYNYSCLIPYRDSTDRRENLWFVLSHLSKLPASVEIILIEQDNRKKIKLPKRFNRVKHVFLKNDNYFNKSWALNCGLNHISTDTIVFHDADFFVDLDVLSHSSYLCKNNYDCVTPWTNQTFLNEDNRQRIFNNKTLDRSKVSQKPVDLASPTLTMRDEGPSAVPWAAGIITIARKALYRIGCWDENFSGWGWEDEAFSYKISMFLKHCFIQNEAIHIYHLKELKDTWLSPMFKHNSSEIDKIKSLSKNDLHKKITEQKDLLGDPFKYTPKKLINYTKNTVTYKLY